MDFLLYFLIYILAGILTILIIKQWPAKFKDLFIESLAHLKETSSRIKYSKEWDDEYEQECLEAKEQYKNELNEKAWIATEETLDQKRIITYFIGWPILFVIVFVSSFFKFFNIYQGPKND